MATETGEPSWKWRRIMVFLVTGFACALLWHMVNAPDTTVNQTIAYGLIFLIAAVVFFYTGMATAQDVVAMWTTKSATPYLKPKDPET